jgi:hypothetical protein
MKIIKESGKADVPLQYCSAIFLLGCFGLSLGPRRKLGCDVDLRTIFFF